MFGFPFAVNCETGNLPLSAEHFGVDFPNRTFGKPHITGCDRSGSPRPSSKGHVSPKPFHFPQMIIGELKVGVFLGMLSASAFARNKPRKRCPQLACPEMLLFGVQARRFRERDSFISNRSRLRNVFITRSLSRSNIRLTGILRTRKAAALSYAKDLDTAKPSRTGITPPTCRERNSKSIVVPFPSTPYRMRTPRQRGALRASPNGYLPIGRAVPFYACPDARKDFCHVEDPALGGTSSVTIFAVTLSERSGDPVHRDETSAYGE